MKTYKTVQIQTKTYQEPSEALASIQSVAELLKQAIEPEMKSGGKVVWENLVEETRNAYGQVLWELYIKDFAGDRQVMDRLLIRQVYQFEPSDSKAFIDISDIQITTLPRDAGLYQVLPYGEGGKFIGKPYVKTTSGAAFQPKSPFQTNRRYYATGREINFPDAHDPALVGFHIVFYGLATGTEFQFIPRNVADLVRDKVWLKYFPSAKQIEADITNNANPNV